MLNKIHGRQVMRMMLESGQSYTKDTLRTAIINQFGEETRFYTCSADNLTADELTLVSGQTGEICRGGYWI